MSRRPVTVVIATRDRLAELRLSLLKLVSLPEHPRVIVVDNGSRDGTARAIAAEFPSVTIVSLGRNWGPAARTIGACRATTDIIAFSDDDSWWEPGSLWEAAGLFERYPRLGLVAATVLVGEEQHLDPVTQAMRASPLPSDGLPGPAVLGFLACGAVVRRSAFLEIGGFPQHRFGGEEQLLAIDLVEAGWRLAHVPSVVAHHHPSTHRDTHARITSVIQNDLRTAVLRRPVRYAVCCLLQAAARALRSREARTAVRLVLGEAPRLLLRRRPASAATERQLKQLRGQPLG